jgi:hypothetical protein
MATLVVITETKHTDARADSPAVLLRREEIMILESQIMSPIATLLNKRLVNELAILVNLEFLSIGITSLILKHSLQ